MTTPEHSSLPTAPTPVESGPVQDGPVQQRSLLPDVLRGLALLGILTVNMQDFAGFNEWQQHGLDRAAQVLTDVFTNGRFISIFAMLFGWGAAGMLAKRAGHFMLRHAILLAVGTAHYVLVWHGDIISLYALLAFLMLLTTRLSASGLLRVAAITGGWWLLVAVLTGVGSLPVKDTARYSALPTLAADYPTLLAGRAAEFSDRLLSSSLYNGSWLLALFCLGAAAQRTGLLSRPQEHQPLLRRLTFWGLLTGLPLGLLLAYLNTRSDFASGVFAIPVRMAGGLASALGYAGVVGLLTVHGRLGWLRHFAASGRVAMSNYVAQSLIMTTVFYPYAGAQWGEWGAAPALALALLVGLLQLPISAWWIRRYGTGPLEWLVRALVYGLPTRQK